MSIEVRIAIPSGPELSTSDLIEFLVMFRAAVAGERVDFDSGLASTALRAAIEEGYTVHINEVETDLGSFTPFWSACQRAVILRAE